MKTLAELFAEIETANPDALEELKSRIFEGVANTCPECGSDNLDFQGDEGEDNAVFESWDCAECGHQFEIKFYLVCDGVRK